MTSKNRLVPAILGLAVLAFLGWGLSRAFAPQRLPLQGQIDAQEVNLSAKVPGRVSKLHVQLGQKVKAGDLVFELDSPEVQAKVAQARAAQEAAQAVAAKAGAGARPEEVEMARYSWERAVTAANIAETTYKRVQAMYDEGVLARQKRDEAEAQWRAAAQQARAAQAQYEMARKGARTEDKQAAQAQARQVGGVLSEAEVALAETRLKAPVAGEVSKIQIQPGELAPQGFPVVTLVNLDDVWAVLQVREDEMSAYTTGSEHTGTVPALGQPVRFRVSSVAVLPDFATWRAARPGGTDLRTFEIRLRPLQPVAALRPGMSVVFPAP
ncbi:HlyD family secretion protein [Eleftheria terrae]|uniref:HlyD family secretion protein n=1 Tax=Eleftheria terrae TaxID=1597781 RepID=UPI00263ACC90|nr:HlyD family efflux transporter periplasmic adaptor subunit [Eleftheria terrae]WKB52698.1 efflux RND transporter periplasmic adaptor subunit [Eleftheria terrae]